MLRYSAIAVSALFILSASVATAQPSSTPAQPSSTTAKPSGGMYGLPSGITAENAQTPAPEAVLNAPVAAAPVTSAPVTETAPVLTAPVASRAAGGVSFEVALGEAYKNNPQLEAARAELRAVDENYAQAMSGYRPAVTGDASASFANQSGDVQDTDADPKTLGVGITQPLYRGGTTSANVKAADNRIKAQRALLHVTEQNVLLDAVTAYMDVLRDSQIVELNVNNEKVLSSRQDAARQRFELGDLTRTDVSQADSRLSAATAARVRAEGNYRASRAVFERVTGLSPDGLQKPTENIMVPSSVDVAIEDARQHNPDMIFAQYSSEAAKAQTDAIRGERLPQVDLTGSVGRTYDPAQRLDSRVDDTSIGLRAVVPLYTGGGTEARIRQARQVEQQRKFDINTAERGVQQVVIDAWTALESAKAEMEARAAQIRASQLALDGVKVEADYGSRTTLDLLDAEQEFLDAQVAYVIAERNKIVAAYRLLASVGDLRAEALGLNVPVYDPIAHFQKVKNKWTGTSAD